MNKIEILYVSNHKDEFFIELRERIHLISNELSLRKSIYIKVKYYDIEKIDSIDFNRYRRKNIYLILHINKHFCKQFNKNQSPLYIIYRMSKELKSSQLLLVSHKGCEALHTHVPLSFMNLVTYDDIDGGIYKTVSYLEHKILNNYRGATCRLPKTTHNLS